MVRVQVLEDGPCSLPSMVLALGHKGILWLLPNLASQAVALCPSSHLLVHGLLPILVAGPDGIEEIPPSKGRPYIDFVTMCRTTSCSAF